MNLQNLVDQARLLHLNEGDEITLDDGDNKVVIRAKAPKWIEIPITN